MLAIKLLSISGGFLAHALNFYLEHFFYQRERMFAIM